MKNGTKTIKKEYYKNCRDFTNEKLIDYNSWIVNKLGSCKYRTYGELQQYLPMNI